jgi:hypothetical protein
MRCVSSPFHFKHSNRPRLSRIHFAPRRAGHVYTNFNGDFVRRGCKVLLRNCLQNVVWKHIDDDRVRAWDYLRLVHGLKNAAAEILDFALALSSASLATAVALS